MFKLFNFFFLFISTDSQREMFGVHKKSASDVNYPSGRLKELHSNYWICEHVEHWSQACSSTTLKLVNSLKFSETSAIDLSFRRYYLPSNLVYDMKLPFSALLREVVELGKKKSSLGKKQRMGEGAVKFVFCFSLFFFYFKWQ